MKLIKNLNWKTSFCFLGTFSSAGSHIFQKFWEMIENSREISRKKKSNNYLTHWTPRVPYMDTETMLNSQNVHNVDTDVRLRLVR